MSIGDFLREWMPRRGRRLAWDENLISDAWFEAHFNYAATAVGEWLGSELAMEATQLVDFGCGDGITALGVTLKSRPRRLIGVDLHQAFSHLGKVARQQLNLATLPNALEFQSIEAGRPLLLSEVDGIYSWSVFEHVDRRDLAPIASSFFDVLRPGGVAFIQVEPLYYSAFGSHLQRVLPEPWAHLRLEPAELEARVASFSGQLEEEDRDLAASEGATPEFKQWLLGEYRNLNRITADELTTLFRKTGFEITRSHHGTRPEKPPVELLKQHDEADLVTNEVRFLARKPS